MTTIIRENFEWLEYQVSRAVDDYLDTYRERIIHDITLEVMRQVFTVACSSMANVDSNQCGKLVIEIDLPDPESCDDMFNNHFDEIYETLEKYNMHLSDQKDTDSL